MRISRQSDCCIRVCISHQSYHSIWISSSVFFWLLNSQRTRQTTYIPSRSLKTTSEVQSEHTRSFHYINITQFVFPLSNSILPHQPSPYYVSFPCKKTCILLCFLSALSNLTEMDSHGTKCYG